MRPIVFLIFGALLVTVALAYPIGVGPRWPATTTNTVVAMPRCYRISYSSPDSAHLPRILRLTADSLHGHFRVVTGTPEDRLGNSFWAPISSDSLGVWLHYHGPVVLLPFAGDTAKGRLAWIGESTIAKLLLGSPSYVSLQAKRVDCAGLAAS
jgi:hypothetical protein